MGRATRLIVLVALAGCGADPVEVLPDDPTTTNHTSTTDTSTTSTTGTNTTTTSQPGNTSGSRLRAYYLAGEDGSQQWLPTWFDSSLSVDCSYARATDGQTRCLPVEIVSTVPAYYADATCTQLALVTCTPSPGYAVKLEGVAGSCGGKVSRVFAVTGPLATVYQGVGINCSPAIVSAGATGYGLGAEVAATTFVAATPQVD